MGRRFLSRTTRTPSGGTVTTTAAGVRTVRSSSGSLVSRTSSRTVATTSRTRGGGTRTVNIKGIVTLRDPSGKLISRTKQPLPTVTRRREGGGTVTVTPGGKVTERDSTGRLIKRFQADEKSARSFILTESKRVTDLVRELERVKTLRQKTPQTKEVKQERRRSTISALKKEKGLAGFRQRLVTEKGKAVKLTQEAARERVRGVKQPKGRALQILKAEATLVGLGALRGVLGVVETIKNPIKTAKAQFQAFRPKNFRATFGGIVNEFSIDPVGTVVEFYIYGKVLNLAGKAVKKSPVGRFVQERLYIQSLPTELRKPVSAFLKSDKVQRKINPGNIPSISSADFLKVKSLTKVEAAALIKAIKKTDSVIFGSFAGKVTGRRPGVKTKLPLPKDVDLATRSVSKFNQAFIENIPRQLRKNYKVQGQKIIRVSNGQALLDIKPLSRLIPSRSLFTRRGELPVTGFVRQLKKRPGSILPTIKKRPGVTRLTIPTGKLVKVKGFKLIGFSEQATRKFLGTLQVLIEKSVRRAKDPQGLLLSLKIQLETLKLTKPKTRIGKFRLKGKIKTLSNSIKILQSKEFARLLEKRVPGITKQFPLLTKINVKRLKNINIKKLNKIAKARAKRAKPLPITKEEIGKPRINDVFKKPSTLPIGQEIGAVSIIPKLKPSKLPKPSRLPRVKPSRIPSRLEPTRLPSRLSKLPRSKIPSSILRKASKISSIIPSMIKISKVPKLKPSKVPVSRIPKRKVSKLEISKLRKVKISKLKARRKKFKKVKKVKKKIKEKEKERRLKKLVEKLPQIRKLIYIPDLYSRIFGIVASKTERRFFLTPGRVFTGIFTRKIIGGK